MRSLPDISIRQLEYLVAVVEAPTWAMAADRVGVSPSALSQGLSELERRVGVELFEARGRRRVLRSSAGPVLDHARHVVALTRDLSEWSDRVRSGRLGRVRLGMTDVAAVVHFSDTVRLFREHRPDVELMLRVAPSADLLTGLRDGEHDLVVCVEPAAAAAGIDTTVVFEEPLVVYAPAGTRVGRPATWGPWVLFPSGSHTRQQVEAALRERGAPVRVVAESHQPEVLRQMVALGIGWTVLPAVQGPADDVGTAGPVVATRRLVLARRSGAIVDPAADDLDARLRRSLS